MLFNPRNRNFYLMLAADAACFCAALALAYFLRFDFALPESFRSQMLGMLKYAVGLKLCVFLLLGLYRGMWRYTSLADFRRLMEAVALSSSLLVAFTAYRFGLAGFSRAVLVVDGLLTLLFTAGLRLSIRAACARLEGWAAARLSDSPARRVLILGAGNLGERLLREIDRTPELNYAVVGFLDDDPAKRGLTVHGRPVLGAVSQLPAIARAENAEELIIAVSRASAAQMRTLVDACKASGLPHRILPPTSQILEGSVATALRPVDYLDLLGRTEARLDEGAVASYVRGRTLLVTGCGGSIGSELCRQLLRFAPARLILVDQSEYNLYAIAQELKSEHGFHDYVRVLGSVGDRALMERTFADHKPSCVLHAAAYKHVPLVEENPAAAVVNNILGTRTVMEVAAAAGVERFVIVSTDKAVRPTNVMGATKRVTELLMACHASTDPRATRFMAVRFGNVVGSSGSVVPLFRKQIERGGPVTVTHPDITRYFMSISEACQLILQAGALGGKTPAQGGQGGEIFVLDMGEPVRIDDMARDLIRLSGKEPGRDIEIVYTGLRAGEKLYEELITAGEGIVRTEHEKILVLGGTLGGDPGSVACTLAPALERLEAAAQAQDSTAIRAILQELVPEFRQQG